MTRQTLEALNLNITIEYDQALSKYTYTRTGGPADILAFPKTYQDLAKLLTWARGQQVPITILGNASNLIVKDGGIEGLVLILTDMNQISIEGDRIHAQAGATLISVSQIAADHHLTGLEFACGIPGSIGGAVYMNAGAYGGEVCDVIETVTVMDLEGNISTLTNAECGFSYRHSVFQDQDRIVLGLTFALSPGKVQDIKEKMADLTYQRQSKQPLEYPSCGSVFKRPTGYFTGQLIQEAGLQGYRIGGAEVSRKHAGFIVNVDGASATDYTDLIAYIQTVIWDQYQVKLEPEVRIIGRDPE